MPADEPLTDVVKVKVIHFSSGETLTDEEEEDEEPLQRTEPGNWTWKDSSWFWGAQILRRSLGFCDFLGEKMAALLGLNAAKYQYAIDQYHRDHKNTTGDRVSSSSTAVNEERINLSKTANKQYGATNTPDTEQQTRGNEGEVNGGFSSNE